MSGKFDASGFEKLQKDLQKLQAAAPRYEEKIAKQLAARLLRLVIKATPVGDYDKPVSFVTKGGTEVSFEPKKGKKGGTLRRGWTSNTQEQAESGQKTKADTYADAMTVHFFGDKVVVEILNPVEYAPYVEYGHRTVNRSGWVPGKFMLTISVKKLQTYAPKVIEAEIEQMLKEVFK